MLDFCCSTATAAGQALLLHTNQTHNDQFVSFGSHVRAFINAAVAVEQQKLHNHHHTNRQTNGVVAVVAFVSSSGNNKFWEQVAVNVGMVVVVP